MLPNKILKFGVYLTGGWLADNDVSAAALTLRNNTLIVNDRTCRVLRDDHASDTRCLCLRAIPIIAPTTTPTIAIIVVMIQR